MTKTCCRCDIIKDVGGFSKSKRSKDGYASLCKQCRHEYNILPEVRDKNREYLRKEIAAKKEVYAARFLKSRLKNADKIAAKRLERVNWFHSLKHNQPCFDCGQRYPFYVLDYDHRDPSTKVKDVGLLATHTNETLFAEIAKCDLICANCHHIRCAVRRPARKKDPEFWSYYLEAKNKPCVDCNKIYAPSAMEFDHRDPTTKYKQVSQLVWRTSLNNLKAEIAKCDVICRNCHRGRSHKADDCRPGCVCLTSLPTHLS